MSSSRAFRLNNYLLASELGGAGNCNSLYRNEDTIRSSRHAGSLHTKNKADEIKTRIRSIDLSIQNEILTSHNAPVYHLDIDRSESRYLLSCSADGIIAIYDLLESNFNEKRKRKVICCISKMRRETSSMTKAVTDVQWFPFDTGMFFSAATEGTVDVWDTNKETITRRFNLENSVNAISFSSVPSTQLLIAAGTSDQKARLCDIRTGMSTHCLSGHREAVLTLKWSPFSAYHLVTGSKDKTIRLWDIRRSDNFLMALDQHNETTERINSANKLPTNEYQPSGSSGISNSDNGISFNNGGGEEAVGRLKSHRSKYFNRQGKAYSTSSIKPNDLTQNSPNMAAKVAPFAHNGYVTSVVWSPDGQFLYSTGTDKKIRRWDMQLGTNTFVDFPSVFNSNMTGNQMCLSYDGNYLFHPNGKQINVYDATTGDLVRYLKGHFERVNCCVFHPHEEILLSGSNDRNVLIWDTSNQEKLDQQENENNNNNYQINNNNNNNNQINNNNNNNDNSERVLNIGDYSKEQQEMEYNRTNQLNQNNNNNNNNVQNNQGVTKNENLTLPDEDNWSDDDDD